MGSQSPKSEPTEIVRGRGRPLGARTLVKSVNLKKVAEIDQKRTNHLQCNVCNLSFKKLVKFTNHCLKQHFNSLFYQYDCGFCYEVHGSRQSFIDHIISQTGGNENKSVAIVCPLCVLPQGASFSEDEFCTHLLQHVDIRGGGQWVCTLPSCEFLTYDIREYAKHIIAVHTNQVVPNSICKLCKTLKSENTTYLKVESEKVNSYVEECDGGDETCPLCYCILKDCNTVLVSGNGVISFEKPKYYRCSICNSGFSTQTKVTKHACRQLHTTYCKDCNIQFTSKKRLVFHLQSHVDPSMTLRCDVCMLTFPDETSCYDHVRFSHESETLCCDTCGKTYITRIGLSMHQMYHDDVRKFKCPECGKRFLNQATLKEHRVSHLNVKPFQCDICGKSLSRASRLRIHLKVHSARNSTNFQKCFTCKMCGYVSFSNERLIEHSVKTHRLSNDHDYKTSILHKLYRCEFCDNCYEMPSLLHIHRQSHNPDSSENPFVCGLCNGLFKTYSRLVTHKLSHGINTETHILQISSSCESSDSFIIPQYFCCKYCDKLYEQYTAYNIHMKHSKHFVPKDRNRSDHFNEPPHPRGRRQTKEKQFVVEPPMVIGAEKRMVHKRELDIAVQSLAINHVGESEPVLFRDRPSTRSSNPTLDKLICCKCGKNFPSEKMLQIHENRHNPRRKRKTFMCEMCPKTFNSKVELRKHESLHHRQHLTCEVCGKEFRYRGWYLLHVENKVCANRDLEEEEEEEDFGEDMEEQEIDEEQEEYIGEEEEYPEDEEEDAKQQLQQKMEVVEENLLLPVYPITKQETDMLRNFNVCPKPELKLFPEELQHHNMHHTGFDEMHHTGLEEMRHTELDEMHHAMLGEMHHPGLHEMHHPELNELHHTGLEDMHRSVLEDLHHSNMQHLHHSEEDLGVGLGLQEMHHPVEDLGLDMDIGVGIGVGFDEPFDDSDMPPSPFSDILNRILMF